MAPNAELAVTIGITAFNCEETLEAAAACALAQDYHDIHILIVDDYSSDSTNKIAKGLAKSNPNVTLISASKNRGVAASRNIIIENTKTPFIAFFDDDDISKPDRISKQLAAIVACEESTHHELILCHPARLVVYPNGNKRYQPGLAQEAGANGVAGPIVSEAILCGTRDHRLRGACPTCSQMARTQTYKVLGGFDQNLRRSEDTELSIRAAENNVRFIGIREPLVHQRMTHSADKNLEIETKNSLYVFTKHRDIIERRMSFSFAINWLYLKHNWQAQSYKKFTLILFKLFISAPFRTLRKLYLSMPNVGINAELSKFHHKSVPGKKP